MRILFVCAMLPYPLYSGGQIRTYNLLSRLAKRHRVTLCTFLREPDEEKHTSALSFCDKIITAKRGRAWQLKYVFPSVIGPYPLLMQSYDHRSLRERIAEELCRRSYDLIHIEPSYTWLTIPKSDLPRVVVEHNVEHAIYADYVRRFPFVPMRPALYWEVLKLRFWEERIWRQANHIVAVSDDDACVIREHVSANIPVTVVPNGVDVTSFHLKKPKKTSNQPVFLFVGSFRWMQNRDAVRWLVTEIWPVLREKYRGSSLRIVGRSMPSALRRLVANHRTILLEHVENIEDELHNADLLIAPIRIGGGTSFKILEAMASGLPVVTTTLGATGLSVTNGKELLIGNTPNELITSVDTLLASEQLRKAMTSYARKKIEQAYGWDRIAVTLDRVWYETAEHKA